jgi:hypothetical protein
MPWNMHNRTHYHLTCHYHLLGGNSPYTSIAHIPRWYRPYPAHYEAHVFCQLELQPPQSSPIRAFAFDPYIQGYVSYLTYN